jgi:hypothetical protein
MVSSEMLRHVALVKTDVSEELSAAIIRMTRIGELVASYGYIHTSSPTLVTLMMEAISFSETSVLTRAIRRNIPEDAILYICIVSSCYVQCNFLVAVVYQPVSVASFCNSICLPGSGNIEGCGLWFSLTGGLTLLYKSTGSDSCSGPSSALCS